MNQDLQTLIAFEIFLSMELLIYGIFCHHRLLILIRFQLLINVY